MNPLQVIALPLFCLAIFVTPWIIGGNYPYVRTVLIAGAAVLCFLALIKQLFGNEQTRFPLLWAVLFIGSAYAVFQATPGSASILENVGIQLPTNYVMSEPGNTISAYPSASRERIVELLAGIAIFFASSCFLYRRKSITTVMLTAVIVGVLIGFVGIVQNLSWNGKILWVYELSMGGFPFGPFVNKNNAGGFLLACFSAATFIVSYQLIVWRPYGSNDSSKSQYFGSNRSNPLKSLAGVVAGLQTRHLYSLTGMAFIAAAIVASLSRGATAALVVSTASCMVLLSSINRWVVVVMLFVAIGVFGLMAYSEQSDSVVAQAETMTDLSTAAAPRLLHWNDALPYVKENVLFGSGPGTYPYLYIAHQERHFERWFRHAENVYLETLGEMGVVGLTTLLLAIILFFVVCWRLFKQPQEFDRALGVAGFCLMIGQAIAWFFDFGIYHPPNMAIVATLAGVVIGRHGYLTSQESGKPGLAWKLATVPVLGVVCVACVFSVFESQAIEALAESKRLMAKYVDSSGREEAILDQVQTKLEFAKKIRPDDSELLFQLGEYHSNRYRSVAVQRLVAEAREALEQLEQAQAEQATSEAVSESPTELAANTGTNLQDNPVNGMNSLEGAWPVTSLSTLHRLAHITKRFPDELHQLRNSAEVKTHLQAAWDAYTDAEKACHSLPKTEFRLAQLSILIDDGKTEWEHLEKALMRMPTDSQLLYDCGLLAIHTGKPDETARMWAQCLSYTRRFEEPIVQFAKQELSMKQFFEQVLPQDPFELLRIAKKYFGGVEQTLSQRLLLVHTRRLADKYDLPEKDKYYLRAESERLSGDLPSAAKSYKLALDIDPSETNWRLSYARVLHKLGQYDDAIKQLKTCQLQSRRKNATYSRLIKLIQRDRKRKPSQLTK